MPGKRFIWHSDFLFSPRSRLHAFGIGMGGGGCPLSKIPGSAPVPILWHYKTYERRTLHVTQVWTSKQTWLRKSCHRGNQIKFTPSQTLLAFINLLLLYVCTSYNTWRKYHTWLIFLIEILGCARRFCHHYPWFGNDYLAGVFSETQQMDILVSRWCWWRKLAILVVIMR